MAFDVFYLTDATGGKLPESRWEEVIPHMERALQITSRK